MTNRNFSSFSFCSDSIDNVVIVDLPFLVFSLCYLIDFFFFSFSFFFLLLLISLFIFFFRSSNLNKKQKTFSLRHEIFVRNRRDRILDFLFFSLMKNSETVTLFFFLKSPSILFFFFFFFFFMFVFDSM